MLSPAVSAGGSASLSLVLDARVSTDVEPGRERTIQLHGFPGLAGPVAARVKASNSRYEMPSLEEHCRQTQRAFGATYEQVHRWLDEFAGKLPYGMRHRQKRHHAAGVQEVRRRWGKIAAEAAQLHIEMDLLEEGWNYDDPFPRNEAHFVGLGLV